MKINDIINEAVGKIVQGVNTTQDVKPGQTEKEAKKFFGGNGKPVDMGVKGATPNQAYNMGLTESQVTEAIKIGDTITYYDRKGKTQSGVVDKKSTNSPKGYFLDDGTFVSKQQVVSESIEEDIFAPITTAKKVVNKLSGRKARAYDWAVDKVHEIISKKGTDAHHGISWYADMIARQLPEDLNLDVRKLVDMYQEKYMSENIDEARDILEYVNSTTDDEITIEDDVELVCEYGELTEAEYQGRKVELNKPIRSSNGPKKFHVFVKNDKGNVVKVNFGDPNMKIKKNVPTARKSFRARHKCDQKKDKTTAGYWSCRAW